MFIRMVMVSTDPTSPAQAEAIPSSLNREWARQKVSLLRFSSLVAQTSKQGIVNAFQS